MNTGSVGRPKDRDWRASYVLLSLESGRVEVGVRRVEYDLDRAMAGIYASDLPDEFAEYLRTGGKPAAASPSVGVGKSAGDRRPQ